MMTAGKLRLDDIVVELITENRITSGVYFSELPSPSDGRGWGGVRH